MADRQGRIHFSGVAGAGMNPLAQLLARRGERVSGSDRALDRGECAAIREVLLAAGVALFPHDGSAISSDVQRLVYSTAVESQTPERLGAAALQIPCQSRPELLAEVLSSGSQGIAVSGTSGKSSIVGMLAWILRSLQVPATVIGGAALAEQQADHAGCLLFAGPDAAVIIEACESDGSLIGYHPDIAVIHNITRDHDEVDGLRRQFACFAQHSQRLWVMAADPEALALARQHPQAQSYAGLQGPWSLEVEALGPQRAQGLVMTPDAGLLRLDLPQPGRHTLDNALAALVLAQSLGIESQAAAACLSRFPGIARRFQIHARQPVLVVDDYAHNGAKISAALRAAQESSGRVLAYFQPHGFAPARFLREELRSSIPQLLRPQDRWCYGAIYYAGGSVAQDISGADLAADIASAYAPDHDALIEWVCSQAQAGDCVLLMGARDPRLPDVARQLSQRLQTHSPE